MLRRPHRTLSAAFALALALPFAALHAEELTRIGVAENGRGFVDGASGQPFVPLGFNYDHDEAGRLLEDYWIEEWDKVEQDFQELADLGASVVRIHLQLGRFMAGPSEPRQASLDQLAKLLTLSDRCGLRLDLTGLGCYHKADVPDWYDALTERERWDAQAAFWEAVAATCRGRGAVFCYDLMNEPVVPGGQRQAGEWLGPAFAGKHFVQFISLDSAGRTRPDVAQAWIRHLTAAIRRHDSETLITVGLVDWSLDRPGLTSGFVPSAIAGDLDFLCVHLYPEAGKVAAALETLEGFAEAGKPVVIEETFPLKCSLAEFEEFLRGSRAHAAGWIGFYWGKTPDELRQGGTIGDALLLRQLEAFQKLRRDEL